MHQGWTVVRRGNMWRAVAAMLLLLTAALVSSCVPSEKEGFREVDDGSDSAAERADPPEFPATGAVPAALLVEGLVFDFTDRPPDADQWTPSSAEATCAAEKIVTDVGDLRLSELGYRAGTPGASLNDVGLDPAEQELVIGALKSCVDLEEGVAAIFFGDGRMTTRAANCMAQGLAAADLLDPFFVAIALGDAVDPFQSDGALAAGLLSRAAVCIPEAGFDWPNVQLPSPDPVLNADAPAGGSGSPYVDDQQSGTTVTTSPPTTTASDTTP